MYDFIEAGMTLIPVHFLSLMIGRDSFCLLKVRMCHPASAFPTKGMPNRQDKEKHKEAA
jgi:hypothetical protein